MYDKLWKRGVFVIDKLKKILVNTLKTNVKGYILIVGIFFAGMILSMIVNRSSGSEEEIRLYISDFITNVKNYSTNSTETFKIAINGYIQLVFFAFLMSVTVIGSIGIVGCVFIKGFSYGSVLIALIDMPGTNVLSLFICAILPHAIISIPCFISYLLYCTKKSCSTLKGIKNVKESVFFPAFYGIACVAALSVASLVQAYVEPVFIRFINFN